jgi:hypothetical protein
MKFFYEELKSTLLFSIMGKTSKIAPRHVRLTLWYFTVSNYLLCPTLLMISGIVKDLHTDSFFETILLVGVSSIFPQLP